MDLSEIRLWSDEAPLSQGVAEPVVPTIQPFLPPKEIANGSALVVLPGGGYGHLSPHEGRGYAEWLASYGFAAYVLRYRLGSEGYRHPAPLLDAQRAVRLVRCEAERWGLKRDGIGIIGSSAGGHLAATAITQSLPGDPQSPDPVERFSSRPDFAILCYPVISFVEHAHQGSCNHLLGPDAAPAAREALSAECRVTPETPPCFIWHTVEDPVVPVENSMLFAAALRRAGVPFELHLYEQGHHGIGLANGHPWSRQARRWLQLRLGSTAD
jgi:acetyl esterase/lipase